MKTTSLSVLTVIVALMAVGAWLAPAALGEEKAAAAPAAPAETKAEAKPAATETKAEAKPAAATDALDEWMAKAANPVPWFKWGADIRLRDEYQKSMGLNSHTPEARGGDEFNYQRYRARWWSTLTPVKDIDLNLRITWEGRHYSESDGQSQAVLPTWVQGGVAVDNANLKLTNIGGSPLTATLGRQDIILGDGWLLMDGTPNDGSLTFFFDAARFTYDLKSVNTTVDLIYIDQAARGDNVCTPLLFDNRGNRFGDVIEQDERGVILWVANKSIKNMEIDGYYMYKDMERSLVNARPITANGDNGHVHTFGARVAGTVGDHWKYRAEGAYEFGSISGPHGATVTGPVNFPDRYLRAFGFNSNLTYLVKDKLNNQLRVEYEYLSGDDPHTQGTDEGFLLLWGRWPRFSELLGYSAPSTGEGRAYELTNYHRLAFGHTFNPCDRVEIATDLHLLFAPENPLGFQHGRGFSEAGSFRGELLTIWQKFTITKHLKAHLLEEFFFPGNYFAAPRDNMGAFLRGELYWTW